MTISTEPAPLSYNGDGSTVNFSITWKYFAKSHVVATLRSTTGTETVWALTTNYTLTAAGVDAGGTLTAVTAPATGEKLVITLEPPNTQESSLPLGGAFPSENVEDALDLSAQRDSKFKNLINRTFRVPVTDTQSGTSLEFPIDTSRAGKYLAFNASGNPIASEGTGTSPAASTFMATVLDDTTAAAARTTLDAQQDVLTTLGDTIVATTAGAAARLPATASIAAHATTSDLFTARETLLTGAAVTFTDIADAPYVGAVAWVYMNAAHIWTDGAVFDVQGGATYTTAIGDWVRINAVTVNTFDVTIFKADGTAVVVSSIGDHCVTVHTGNGHGSTKTKYRRFTTTMTNTGTAITYADSDANGNSFTINAAGDYEIFTVDRISAGNCIYGFSINDSSGGLTSIHQIAVAERAAFIIWPTAGTESCISRTVRLAINDVVHAHTDGAPNFTGDSVFFSIRKVSNG